MASYPLILEIEYKDQNLDIKIPIRVKKFKTHDLVCKTCDVRASSQRIINYYLKEKQKWLNSGEDIPCPHCNKLLEKKEKELYMLYTGLNKPFINIHNIISKITFFRWTQKNIHHSTQVYSIFEKYSFVNDVIKDLIIFTNNKHNYTLCAFLKNYKIKTYKVTKKQLDQAWDDYMLRKIARKI